MATEDGPIAANLITALVSEADVLWGRLPAIAPWSDVVPGCALWIVRSSMKEQHRSATDRTQAFLVRKYSLLALPARLTMREAMVVGWISLGHMLFY